MASNKIKIFRVTGEFFKPQKKMRIPMMMEVRAHLPEHALERVYSEIGSRHRVKRQEIFIPKKGGIVEIKSEEARYKLFEDLDKPDFVIYRD